MPVIRLEIDHCGQCPRHKTESTNGSRYALDYYCQLTGTKIGGYIEVSSELKAAGIPGDCPLLEPRALTAMREACEDR